MEISSLIQHLAHYAPDECKVQENPSSLRTISLPFVSFSLEDLTRERYPGSIQVIMAGIQYSIQALVLENSLSADMQINSMGRGRFNCSVTLSLRTKQRSAITGEVCTEPAIAWLSAYVLFLEQRSLWNLKKGR